MHYVFGPVPSRRLGRSLGVDPVPLKTCNWNCIYCQLGRSTPMTNQRREWVPTDDVLAELRQQLGRPRDDVDWVTFVGSGEPTLHSGIGRMIHEVKGLCDKPVAVITNGSLLWMPEVRNDLLAADAVMPTLAAGDPQVYRALHRPHPECTFERLVEGVREFRAVYTGKLWVEVMLVARINDDDDSLRQLAEVLRSIRPDEVHLTLPTRPPAEAWVEPPDDERLMRAVALLGEVATLVPPAPEGVPISDGDPTEAILGVITRHPMREPELLQLLPGLDADALRALLARLQAAGSAQPVHRHGHVYWTASGTTRGRDLEANPTTARLRRRCGTEADDANDAARDHARQPTDASEPPRDAADDEAPAPRGPHSTPRP